MSPNDAAIAIFLFGFGTTLALAELALGLTLFRAETPSQSKVVPQQSFWFDRWIATQKPEYHRFSYGITVIALTSLLAGVAWTALHTT